MKLRNKKTGETKEFDSVNVLKNSDCTLAEFVYHSLAELNEEWEDVGDTNVTNIPLIKDEKIRKAVRAWAEACCIELIEITHSRKSILRAMDAITNNDEICINRELGQILDEKVYNIDELCGEEEE